MDQIHNQLIKAKLLGLVLSVKKEKERLGIVSRGLKMDSLVDELIPLLIKFLSEQDQILNKE